MWKYAAAAVAMTAFFASQAHAEAFYPAGKTDKEALFMVGQVKNAGPVVNLWAVSVALDPKAAVPATRIQFEANCGERQLKRVTNQYLDREGGTNANAEASNTWKSPAPDSLEDLVLTAVCTKGANAKPAAQTTTKALMAAVSGGR